MYLVEKAREQRKSALANYRLKLLNPRSRTPRPLHSNGLLNSGQVVWYGENARLLAGQESIEDTLFRRASLEMDSLLAKTWSDAPSKNHAFGAGVFDQAAA